jgi:hypothetical protein
MSLAEYLWTGQTLRRDSQGGQGSTPVEAADAMLVLNLAAAWGQAERVR